MSPPSGGWDSGTYKLQVKVTGNGPRPCIISLEKLLTFTVTGPTPMPTPLPAAVPATTPIGIIALIGLLSVIAAISVRRRKEKNNK